MILGMRQGRGSMGISCWRYSKARRCLKSVALESLEYASEAEQRLIRVSSQIGHHEILPLGYLARLENPFNALTTIKFNRDKKGQNNGDPMSPYLIGASSLYMLAVALCESSKGPYDHLSDFLLFDSPCCFTLQIKRKRIRGCLRQFVTATKQHYQSKQQP